MDKKQNSNITEVTEEFLRKEHTHTEFDAIHPRFYKQDENEIKKYQEENYYYCKECEEFFAPTVTGLNTHFKGDMTKHMSIGSCFYCKGRVYEYYKDDVRNLYHNCRDKDKPC